MLEPFTINGQCSIHLQTFGNRHEFNQSLLVDEPVKLKLKKSTNYEATTSANLAWGVHAYNFEPALVFLRRLRCLC